MPRTTRRRPERHCDRSLPETSREQRRPARAVTPLASEAIGLEDPTELVFQHTVLCQTALPCKRELLRGSTKIRGVKVADIDG